MAMRAFTQLARGSTLLRNEVVQTLKNREAVSNVVLGNVWRIGAIGLGVMLTMGWIALLGFEFFKIVEAWFRLDRR